MTSRERLLQQVARLEGALAPAPIMRLEHPDVNLFAKLEFCNAAGSVKDKPAFCILRAAIDRGDITPTTTIIESSSGNFANALALFSRALGLRFMPVIDPNISPTNEACLRTTCDSIVKVHDLDDRQGYLKTRLARIRELQATLPDVYWPNQYANRDAIEAHYRFTGTEICNAFSSLDYVFVGVSTCGTISGVSRRVKEKFPHAKIIAVDAEGSLIFGGAPKKRCIPGIGATVAPALLREASIDDVVIVPEVETIRACRALLDEHGLFVGGSSGSAYSAIQMRRKALRGARKPNVLFLCCDRGSAYLDTVFDDAWVAGHIEGAERESVASHRQVA